MGVILNPHLSLPSASWLSTPERVTRELSTPQNATYEAGDQSVGEALVGQGEEEAAGGNGNTCRQTERMPRCELLGPCRWPLASEGAVDGPEHTDELLAHG